jgi:hypothetical protein
MMDGVAFERWLGHLFEQLGYRVELTEHYDWGADLIIIKDNERIAAQAKRWDQPVGQDAVQAVVAALLPYKCSSGMVITNNIFTLRARHLAEMNHIQLWDRAALINAIDHLQNNSGPAGGPPQGATPAADARQSRCARCDVPVTDGVRDWCLRTRKYKGQVYCVPCQRANR